MEKESRLTVKEMHLINELSILSRQLDKVNLSELEREALRLEHIKKKLNEYWSQETI